MGWFIKFWEWLWLRGMKNWVSKLRWCRKSKVQSEPVYEINDTTMMGVVRELYYGFDWHMDGIDDLFDTYMPAQYAYNLMYNYIEDKSEEKNPGDCFTGDVKIKCLDGKSYTFKELVDNGVKELWVYSCTPEGDIVPAKAINPVKKMTDKPLVKITFDNGETVKCTEDHRFMLRNGAYKMAKDIIPEEDSLMPGYFKESGGYLWVKNNRRGNAKMIPVHRLVNGFCNEEARLSLLERLKEEGREGEIISTHHIDKNKHNNNPENLLWIPIKDHGIYHLVDYNKSDKHRKTAAEMGPSNGTRRLLEYNSSEDHKNTVRRMNKEKDFILLHMQGKILKTLQQVYTNGEEFCEENYRKYKPRTTPNFDNIEKYFESKEEAFEAAKTYNHKVISVEYLKETEPVYDITVPGTHNFLLDAGVFVHNCDDFHAGILHLLQENGYDTALITLATIPITQSHTMTAFRKRLGNDTYDYYVINYTRCLGPYDNLQDFVDNYGTPVRYWCLQGYNLEKGKYYNIDKEWGGVIK